MSPVAATPEILAEGRALLQESRIRHVAVIMDGNRRWAKARNLPTLMGHKQGVDTLRELVRYGGQVGLEALTVYAFSTENWRRSEEEVGYLMNLFVQALAKEVSELGANNVDLRFIGDLASLPEVLREEMQRAVAVTAGNTGLKLQVAFNYGSRAELAHAARTLARQVQAGTLLVEEITEASIESVLYTVGLPDPDLLIRTGGESRLSNYLLWQCAYTEFYITEKPWPDFSPTELNLALEVFCTRERRYGQ